MVTVVQPRLVLADPIVRLGRETADRLANRAQELVRDCSPLAQLPERGLRQPAEPVVCGRLDETE